MIKIVEEIDDKNRQKLANLVDEDTSKRAKLQQAEELARAYEKLDRTQSNIGGNNIGESGCPDQ